MILSIGSLSQLQHASTNPFAYRKSVQALILFPGIDLDPSWPLLRKFPSVLRLSLEGMELSLEACQSLSSWLSEQRVLQSLALSRTPLDPQWLFSIAQGLRSVHSLQSLSLNSCNTSYGALRLMTIESSLSLHLHHLSFANNPCSEEGLDFSRSLPTLLPHLQTLIAGQSLFVRSQSALGLQALLHHPKISCLQISGTDLHYDPLSHQDLPQNAPQGSDLSRNTNSAASDRVSPLHTLYARMLQVDWHAIDYLKKLFPWKNLHSLSLSHNPWISKDFFMSERSWPHLRNLDLAYCRLSSSHSSALRSLFDSAPNLSSLSLQGNFGLHSSLKDLLPALTLHQCLSWLNLSGLSGSTADSQIWLHAILRLPSLSTLLCHDCDLSDNTFQEFLREAEKHTCLTHIACQNNSLPYSTLFLVEAMCQRQKERLRDCVAIFQKAPKDLADWQDRFLRAHVWSYHADVIKIFPIKIRRLYLQKYIPSLSPDFDLWCREYDLSLPLAFMHSPFFLRKLEH